MCGLSTSCVLYVVLFLLLPTQLRTVSSQDEHDFAEKLYRNNSLSGVVNPFSFITYKQIFRRMKQMNQVLAKYKTYKSEKPFSPCEESLDVFYRDLLLGQMWALQMVDASTKIPSGVFGGNLVDLGAYDECVDITVVDDRVQFTGQHCLLVLQLKFKTLPNLASPGVLAALGNSLAYTFSLCLPSACSPALLNKSLASLTPEINPLLARYANLTVELVVKKSDCHVKNRPDVDSTELIGIVVTLCTLIWITTCTVVDLALTYPGSSVYRDSDLPTHVRVLVAFSLYRNWKRLLSTKSSEGTIHVLHALKFFSIAWVALGHRIKFSAQEPLFNLLNIASYIEYWSTMVILNATLSVDVFFVISGILNTYVYMNGSRRGKSVLSHFMGYVHRYIRLTPAYALMILVTGTWLYRTGDGPLWDRVVGDAKNDCTNYWWSGLIYINNYYNPNNNCMMQSWYLAADMQLYWLSPLVLYPLWRWPRLGLFNLALLVILSIIVPFLVAYVDLIKTPIPISFDTAKVNREMQELYIPTHTKTISYVIGILAGYLIHLIRSEKIEVGFRKTTNVLFWVLSFASMGWALFGAHYIFQFDSPYDRWQSSIYIGFYRFFWSIGIAWIIVACALDRGGFINAALSHKVFMPLGRLTYCIYLTHVAVILYDIGSMRQPQYFSYYGMVTKFLGEFVIATFLATILSLIIESPIMALERVLLFRKHDRGSVTV